MKTVLDPLAAASWPISVAATALLFRAPIKAALGRVRSIKGPGVEAELQPDVSQNQALAIAADARATNLGSGLPPADEVLSDMDAQFLALLEREVANDTHRLAWAIRSRSISEASRLHEAHYRVIFGSQIKALRALNSAGPTPPNQYEHYLAEAKANPDFAAIHETRTFEQWGQFLVAAGYVRQVPGSGPALVEITPFGRHFLMWMAYARVSEYRPG